MNVIAILAGGVGLRMNSGNLPKQFLLVNNTPIIIKTIIRCMGVEEFDYCYIAIHEEYVDYLKDLLNEYKIDSSKIRIVTGGKERIDTIQNVIDDIYMNFKVDKDDVIVVHDAVRPFVSRELLLRSIVETMKHDATVAVLPSIDTMYVVENGMLVQTPDRKSLFNGQSPDSFKIEVLKKALDGLSAEDRLKITGTAQICISSGIQVHAIEGDYKNIKLTTPHDLIMAEKFYEDE